MYSAHVCDQPCTLLELPPTSTTSPRAMSLRIGLFEISACVLHTCGYVDRLVCSRVHCRATATPKGGLCMAAGLLTGVHHARYYTILYYTILLLYYTILYYTILYNTILYILYYTTLLNYTISWYSILYDILCTQADAPKQGGIRGWTVSTKVSSQWSSTRFFGRRNNTSNT